jgi:hypothetical protein
MSLAEVRSLLAVQRVEEALALCMQCCEQQPDDAAGWMMLGSLHGMRGEFTAAEGAFRRALALRENLVEAHRALAIALQQQGYLIRAFASLRRVLELSQASARDWVSLGMQQQAVECTAQALESYTRAIALESDCAEAHLLRALCLLQTGDYAQGWGEYEWRWKWKGRTPRPMPVPEWDGMPLAGRTILLHPEQGFGDSIQFIRFAPLVKALGARVLVETHRPLARLLARCEGIDHLFVDERPVPRFDCHAPFMSLPRLLGITLDTLPASVPYVFASQAAPAALAARLAEAGNQLKVGLVWAGGPTAKNDHIRSCPWQHFQTLGGVTGVHFFSLQKGPAAADLGQLRASLPLTDLADLCADFADSAHAMSALDLIISVDTAAVHLAGALGRPVWVLLPTNPDWRWLLGREDSPWYPTARLFRQRGTGDWVELLGRVTQALPTFTPLSRTRERGGGGGA